MSRLSLQVFLVRKAVGPDAGQLYAMKVLKKATLKGGGSGAQGVSGDSRGLRGLGGSWGTQKALGGLEGSRDSEGLGGSRGLRGLGGSLRCSCHILCSATWFRRASLTEDTRHVALTDTQCDTSESSVSLVPRGMSRGITPSFHACPCAHVAEPRSGAGRWSRCVWTTGRPEFVRRVAQLHTHVARGRFVSLGCCRDGLEAQAHAWFPAPRVPTRP